MFEPRFDSHKPVIDNVRVDWMERWANSPVFHVTMIDPEGMDYKNMRTWPASWEDAWVRFPSGIHMAESEAGNVAYFYTDGKPTHGFGGRKFSGRLLDGTPFEYTGAWSSRAACVNADLAKLGLPRIVDVVIDSCATAVYADLLIDWWRDRPDRDWGLAWVDDHDASPILVPTRDGMLKKSMQHASIVQVIER